MSEVDSTDKIEAARARRLRWYYRNAEKARAANKEWCHKNKDRKNKTRRASYDLNKDDPAFREKMNARTRARKRNNPETARANRKSYRIRQKEHLKIVSRRNHLRRKFGMTVAQYEAMLQQQNGRCAICGTDNPFPHNVLTVDHDHVTGKNRALLCFHCNAGLGHFRDDEGRLQAAMDYLRRHGDSNHSQDDPTA